VQVAGLGSKVAELGQEMVVGRRETKVEVAACTDSLGKVNLKLTSLMQSDECRATQVKTVREAQARVEREGEAKREEDVAKMVKLKGEMEGVVKTNDAVRKDVDSRVENMRKNMIEMIGNNEMKTVELEEQLNQTNDVVKNVKIIQSNTQAALDGKIKAVKDDFENLLNEKIKTKNPSTLDLEKVTEGLKKEIDQVKTDLRNDDLESFKNIVNSTNDTHNKLISSIQKNVDLIIREKSELEGQVGTMEERITEISILR
jgi:hypothetical protein